MLRSMVYEWHVVHNSHVTDSQAVRNPTLNSSNHAINKLLILSVHLFKIRHSYRTDNAHTEALVTK